MPSKPFLNTLVSKLGPWPKQGSVLSLPATNGSTSHRQTQGTPTACKVFVITVSPLQSVNFSTITIRSIIRARDCPPFASKYRLLPICHHECQRWNHVAEVPCLGQVCSDAQLPERIHTVTGQVRSDTCLQSIRRRDRRMIMQVMVAIKGIIQLRNEAQPLGRGVGLHLGDIVTGLA